MRRMSTDLPLLVSVGTAENKEFASGSCPRTHRTIGACRSGYAESGHSTKCVKLYSIADFNLYSSTESSCPAVVLGTMTFTRKKARDTRISARFGWPGNDPRGRERGSVIERHCRCILTK